jgi:glycosyltransferase involved in cell wall biosynthesis
LKLVVQIPCFNEESTLPQTLRELPTQIDGVDEIRLLVVDDGSTDRTSEVARRHGVDRVVRIRRNRGLANAFARGLDEALGMGADIIVNTDADNQYHGGEVPRLIAPILRGEADVVIGDRAVASNPHFSPLKRLLQRLGSAVVRWASGTSVADATSGFRALSREAAMRLVVYSTYTYTLETIIQAGHMMLDVVSVPVATNPRLRQSRLISSLPAYLVRSVVTNVRIFLMYRALEIFATLGLFLFGVGFVLGLRYVYFLTIGQEGGHVQSLILAAILILLGFQAVLLGLVADLVAKNRRLAEAAAYRLRRLGVNGT